MVGKRDGKYYLSPHLLGRYLLRKREAIDAFFGRKKPETKEMKLGKDWHEKLGFTNEELFEKEFELDGRKIVLRGVPDYIDEDTVAELKTVGGKYVSERYLESAEVQLLAYLFLTDRPNGQVVVVNRETGDTIEKFRVFRNDEKLFSVIRRFIRDVERRENSSKALERFLSARPSPSRRGRTSSRSA